jgi:hypothetical protein
MTRELAKRIALHTLRKIRMCSDEFFRALGVHVQVGAMFKWEGTVYEITGCNESLLVYNVEARLNMPTFDFPELSDRPRRIQAHDPRRQTD